MINLITKGKTRFYTSRKSSRKQNKNLKFRVYKDYKKVKHLLSQKPKNFISRVYNSKNSSTLNRDISEITKYAKAVQIKKISSGLLRDIFSN